MLIQVLSQFEMRKEYPFTKFFFSGTEKLSKSSYGWFCGFKLHTGNQQTSLKIKGEKE